MELAWHDLAGGVGVACIVGSYLLLQAERLDPRGVAYSTLNAMGATLVIVSLCFAFNASAFTVEAFWLAISLWGLGRARRRRGG